MLGVDGEASFCSQGYDTGVVMVPGPGFLCVAAVPVQADSQAQAGSHRCMAEAVAAHLVRFHCVYCAAPWLAPPESHCQTKSWSQTMYFLWTGLSPPSCHFLEQPVMATITHSTIIFTPPPVLHSVISMSIYFLIT